MGGKIHIRFWGTRGSIAAPGKSTSRYGGNTSCLEILYDGQRIICDAGTGIRSLGNMIEKERKHRKNRNLPILLTHTHWDHICGLPFFAPIYSNGRDFDIYGPAPTGKHLGSIIRTSMRSEFFPRQLASLPSKISFHTVRRKGFYLGEIRVTPLPVCHPGGAVGWGFEFPGGEKLVFVSDNELNVRTPYRNSGIANLGTAWWRELFDYACDADLLIHDAQYTSTEYKKRSGWGHSSYAELLGFALRAEVDHLMLFHHDPERSDRDLEKILSGCRRIITKNGSSMRCDLAREGTTLKI
jgi:ribonuclease BN (tRNA processing enzyme)